MTLVLTICLGGLISSSLIGLYAFFRNRDDGVRTTVADLLYFVSIAVFITFALQTESSIVFDVALIGSLLGILSTLALARILSGGRR